VLQFRHFLARNLHYSRRNRRYSLSQMILALVYPLVLVHIPVDVGHRSIRCGPGFRSDVGRISVSP
jgi:hypothetical protein